MQSFLAIGSQILILFALIGVGAFAYKIKLWKENGVSQMTTLVLYLVIPMMTIESMQIPFEVRLLKGAGIAALFAVITHLIAIVLSRLLLPATPERKKRMYSYAVISGNMGFFGFPLISLSVGPIGVFYASIYLLVFHIFVWTYGVYLLSKDLEGNNMSLRRALINPGVISVFIALFLFISGIRLPGVLMTVVSSIASLNRPLGMMVVGAEIAAVSLGAFWKDKHLYIAVFMRLLLIPAIVLPLLLLLTNDRTLSVGAFVPVLVPTATNIVMFASRFKQDTLAASRALAVTTLFSMLTVPLWLWLLDLLRPA